VPGNSIQGSLPRLESVKGSSEWEKDFLTGARATSYATHDRTFSQ